MDTFIKSPSETQNKKQYVGPTQNNNYSDTR